MTGYRPTGCEMSVTTEWFSGHELEVHKVTVSGEEYDMCDEASKQWWTTKKSGGSWNPGMLNNPHDVRKTERIGILGEMSFGALSGMPVNLEYNEFGNTADFRVMSHPIDIKTAARGYGLALIRCVDEFGRQVELGCDIYTFAYMDFEDRNARTATVAHVGYVTKSDLSGRQIVKARKGRHRNYEFPYHELKPISKFLGLLSKFETAQTRPL